MDERKWLSGLPQDCLGCISHACGNHRLCKVVVSSCVKHFCIHQVSPSRGLLYSLL